MSTYYTHGIKDGSDLKVNNYLLRTATAMKLFSNFKNNNVDLTKLTKKQLVEGVQTDFLKAWEAADNILELQAGEAKAGTVNAYINYLFDGVTGISRKNKINSVIAGIFYDSLPGGEVEQKLGNLAIKDPNELELEELFGKKYSSVMKQKPEDQIKSYEQTQKMLSNLSEEQKAGLLAKKINFEQKNYNSDINQDTATKARYDGMMNLVRAWRPQYKNSFDIEIENKAEEYFIGHKKFALIQLIESKSADCYSEKQLEQMKKEFTAKIEKLKNTKPADFVNRLQNEISTCLADLSQTINKKQQQTSEK